MNKTPPRSALAIAGLGLLAAIWMSPLFPEPAERLLIWRPALFSDLVISHLPISSFVNQAFTRWGQLPLWNPVWLGGLPLVADPLAATLYPPHWLTYLWPSLGAYNLLLFLHLIWTGYGLFRLGRTLGISSLAAFVAAVAWSGSPRLIGTMGLGHVTLVYAVSWTPWLLLAVHHAVEALAGGTSTAKHFSRVGGLMGLIFLADPRWFLPAALSGVAYATYLVLRAKSYRDIWRKAGIGVLLTAGIGVSLGAGLAVPLLRLIPNTTRSNLDPVSAGSIHVTGTDMLGLGFPDPLHWPETNVALGVVVVALALIAIVSGGRDRWFWMGAGVTAWIFAFGESGPIYPLLSRWLPGGGLLRVPARFHLVAALSAALLAGYGLDNLIGVRPRTNAVKRIRLGLVGFLGAIVFIAVGLTYFAGPQFLLGRSGTGAAIFFAGAAVLVGLSVGKEGRRAGQVLVALVVLELTVIHLTALEARPLNSRVPAPLEARLSGSWGDERVFSPTYSLPGWWAVRHGVETADGVHPLQPREHWGFMAQSVGFSGEEYSVTLPPFPGGDPLIPRYADLDAERLGLLNIGWVAAAHSLDNRGLVLEGDWHGTWLYAVRSVRPRAWVQSGSELSVSEGWSEVESLTWSPNRVEVRARGKGKLVLAQNALPGWRVNVDGQQEELEAIGELLLGVEIGEGQHSVVFSYQPVSVLVGVGLTLLGLLALIGLEIRP